MFIILVYFENNCHQRVFIILFKRFYFRAQFQIQNYEPTLMDPAYTFEKSTYVTVCSYQFYYSPLFRPWNTYVKCPFVCFFIVL